MLHVQLNYATTNVSQLSIVKSPSVVHQGLFVKAPNSMVFTMWAVQNDTVVNSGHDLGLGWHSVFLAANDMHDIFVFSVFFFLWWRYLVSSKRGKRHDEVFHERATMFYTVLHTVVCAIWKKQGSKRVVAVRWKHPDSIGQNQQNPPLLPCLPLASQRLQ